MGGVGFARSVFTAGSGALATAALVTGVFAGGAWTADALAGAFDVRATGFLTDFSGFGAATFFGASFAGDFLSFGLSIQMNQGTWTETSGPLSKPEEVKSRDGSAS